jgi:hypothetical protein
MLGERELPLEAGAAEVFWEWLDQLLQPLEIPADFRRKILQSTLDAATPREAAPEGARVQLSLWMPAEPARTPQGWGFFRVETIGNAREGSTKTRHEIKVYLYREGN